MKMIGRREVLAVIGAASALPQRALGARTAGTASSWAPLATEPYHGKQDDISFVDQSTGWYGNGAGKLYRTSDGGDTWQKVWEHPGTFIRALGFLDARRGFLGNVGVDYYPGVTDRNPLYRTDDGGVSWAPVSAPGIEHVAGICGIDILPVKRIFQGELQASHIVHAAGRVGGPTAVMRSEDDGLTWTVHDLSKMAGMILDVKFHTPHLGFVAASAPSEDGSGEAMILRTEDGCRTWTIVYRSGRKAENVWKMSWPTPQVGYGTVQSYDDANLHRVFVKTVDGGRSWREYPLINGPHAQEFGVGFVDAAHGWIGCASGGLETRNGGKTWIEAPIGRAVNKIRVIRAPGQTRLFSIGVDLHRLDLS